jgi:hypothetical protein
MQRGGFNCRPSSPVPVSEAEVDFRLTPPQFLGGQVLLPDGHPADRVVIHIVQKQYELQTLNGRVERARNGTEVVTDDEGRFSLPKAEQPRILVISHDAGFAGFTDSQLGQTNVITLTRWARISGKIRRGNGVDGKAQVALWIPQEWIFKDQRSIEPALQPFGTYQMTTYEDGRFEFDRVPPGEVAIGTVDPFPRPTGQEGAMTVGEVWGGRRRARIRIAPGDSQNVEIGGQGRTVTGTIRSPGAFAHVEVRLNRVLPPIPYPDGLDIEARKKWIAEWFWSERGAPYRLWLAQMPRVLPNGWNRDLAAPWQVHRHEDGSITLVDVPAGEYVLSAQFLAEPSSITQMPAVIRKSECKFTVDPAENLQSLPPIDLGVIGGPADDDDPYVSAEMPNASNPVTTGMRLNLPTNSRTYFEIVVRLRLATGYHIYGTDEVKAPFQATSLELKLPEGFYATAPWSAPPSETSNSGPIFNNSIVFRRWVNGPPNTPPGQYPVGVEVRYQACNQDVCFPPSQTEVRAMLTISSPVPAKP